MKDNIRMKIEECVLIELEEFTLIDETKVDYGKVRNEKLKRIKTFTDILQKEDDDLNNQQKIGVEYKKLQNNYDIEMIKTKEEIVKNKNNFEIDSNKVENDRTKINNEFTISYDKLKMEQNKNNKDYEIESRKIDCAESKNKQDYNNKKTELILNKKYNIELRNDRIAKVLIDGITVVVPIIFYNMWMNRGFTFEEKGTYTSKTFMNLFNKFRPTK